MTYQPGACSVYKQRSTKFHDKAYILRSGCISVGVSFTSSPLKIIYALTVLYSLFVSNVVFV